MRYGDASPSSLAAYRALVASGRWWEDEPMTDSFTDRAAIRELIERWVIWRDGGDWDRFATLWHPQGWMAATWFQAPAADFIAHSRAAWDGGLTVYHTLGGTAVDVAGDRAVAETRMQIVQRAPVHGVEADVTCLGRFWDACERVEGRWLLRLRQPIYELDWIRPVDPSVTLRRDPALLASFPVGYRHLAYLQTGLGFDVARDLPGTRGSEVEALREKGRRWLAGEDPF